MIITMDGPAGSGKSTVAKEVSKKLNFIHFNSGLLYRGITAHLSKLNFDIESIKINSKVPKFKLKTKFIDNIQHVFVNDTDYTAVLRDNNISKLTPFVSTNKVIRKRIDKCQREFAKFNNIVVDGRDTGSFVFPRADFKFYLDCSIKERAKRRFNEEKVKNPSITLSQIEQELETRDHIDKTKKIAPLVVPKNAIVIDSTNLNIQEVVETILKQLKN